MAVDDVYVPLAGIAAVAIHDEGDMAGDWACGDDAEGDALCVLAQDFGPPSEHSEEPGEHVYRGNAPSSVDLETPLALVMRHSLLCYSHHPSKLNNKRRRFRHGSVYFQCKACVILMLFARALETFVLMNTLADTAAAMVKVEVMEAVTTTKVALWEVI